jgi:hypothetical protein
MTHFPHAPLGSLKKLQVLQRFVGSGLVPT